MLSLFRFERRSPGELVSNSIYTFILFINISNRFENQCAEDAHEVVRLTFRKSIARI